MRRAGLEGRSGQPMWRRPEPDQIATNLADRTFVRTRPGQLWITDISKHPTCEGKAYCCVVLDAYSRRVVGLVDRPGPDRHAGDQRVTTAHHGIHRPVRYSRAMRSGGAAGPGRMDIPGPHDDQRLGGGVWPRRRLR